MPLSKIPSDISKLIISRLPVKSVLVCKCVCKSRLKVISCLISDPDFVQMHLDFHRQNSTRLMFGRRIDEEDRNDTQIHSIGYDSLASLLLPKIEAENDINDVEMPVIEDNNDDVEMDYSSSSDYTRQMDHPFKNSGLTVDLFGSCNGILCIWFHADKWSDDQEQFFCLWNPATNEYKRISEAPKRYNYWGKDITLHALVYDPTADDYKFIIAVSSEDKTNEIRSLVHAYSLASDSWKSFLTPYDFYYFAQQSGVLFNGDLHWLSLGTHYSIVSLDIKNEKFKEIEPPLGRLQLSLVWVLEDRLCVVVEDENDDINIWAMQVYGDPKSWTKSYTVTHEIITSRIRSYGTVMKFMWSFKNGVILFTDPVELYLYDHSMVELLYVS
ncbi:F-box/kelch-repeat protein At3g06240-like [Papaver somniferum]|uniref:F-box/kelch-repeat protein At3g06240-like n=1 Tax=Papaver somniferum TaxID=3469 RepID=UPI000E700B1C|nr:F-box/kelch-repeat protein At3g06240-like [Papaver somniferum]